jgi:hypothetical protein
MTAERKFRVLLGALLAVPAILAGQALQGVSFATFLNPQPTCPPAVCTGLGTQFITWGRGTLPSRLQFNGRDFTAEVNRPFVVGEAHFFNGSIDTGSGISAVDLLVESLLTDSRVVRPRARTVVITNTQNSTDPFASADSLSIRRGPDFFVLEGASATGSVIGIIRRRALGGAVTNEALAAPISDDLELELLGFGEVIAGDGFIGTIQDGVARVVVPVDVKPQSCPNPFNTASQGVVPISVVGKADFDVSTIDPDSIRLNGVPPVRWEVRDGATPFVPYSGKQSCSADCTTYGADGVPDLELKFDVHQLVATLGHVEDRECRLLRLTGRLLSGLEFVGEDLLLVLSK